MTKLGGKLKKELFLICYDRSFSVYRLDKNNLSYSLNADQVEVSLKKRGLDSRLEMRGLNPKYSSVPPHPAQVTKPIENVQTIDEIKQIEPANINNMSEIVPKYSSNIINLYTQGLPIKSIVSSVFKARKAIDKETNAKHVQQEVELEILKYVTEVAV
jgi:hypothetical protein